MGEIKLSLDLTTKKKRFSQPEFLIKGNGAAIH